MLNIPYKETAFAHNIPMNKIMKNLSLFISAFIPLYVLIALKILIEIINDNLSFNILNTSMLTLSIFLIIFGIIGLLLSTKYENSPSIEIVILSKQNITDQHFLGYFSLFVLFAITFELEKVSMAVIFVIVLTFIGIVYIKNKLYYINPFLNIVGYSFYEITYKEKDSNESKTAKIFYKGELNLNKNSHWVKIKNENFSFIDKSKN